LIRRKDAGEAFALTTPLIKKADGSKFGKTESGNIWLDPEKTSPYKFYQFWINASDQDVENYIRIFSLNGREEIESLISDHAKEPHLRLLQKSLAAEITARVHSADALAKAQDASEILFGKGTREMLGTLSEKQILEVFEGVPTYNLPKSELEAGIPLIELLVAKSTVFPSKGEARKMIQQGGVLINKEKADDVNLSVNTSHLLSGNSILVQKGKKNYFLFRIQ
jgi:tyrosyl-tRNA synthetase